MARIVVAEIVAEIQAETGSFDRGVDAASKKVQSFAKTAQASLSKGGGFLQNALGTATGVLTGNFLTGAISQVADFGRGLIGANANAETLRNTLNVAAGSMEKGGQIYSQLQKMAAATPFEFPELAQSAANLEALGFNSLKYIETIGNASAATNKSVDQTTQALMDAAVGEWERLKEYGIRARTEGQKTTLSYMQNGKMVSQIVDNTNQEMILSTINGIWNDKYAGAMDTQSKSFNGMWSTLQDNLNLTLQRMSGGMFEWAKSGLGVANSFFDNFNRGLDRGQNLIDAGLGAIRKTIRQTFGADAAKSFSAITTRVKQLGAAALEAGRTGLKLIGPPLQFIKDNLGPIAGAAAPVVAGLLMFTKVVPAISGVTTAIKAFGLASKVALLSPIGLVITALAAFGIAYQTNFLGFKDFVDSNLAKVIPVFQRVWDAVKAGIAYFEDWKQKGLDPVWGAVNAVGTVLETVFGKDNPITTFFNSNKQTIAAFLGYLGSVLGGGDPLSNWLKLMPDAVRPFAAAIGTAISTARNFVTGLGEAAKALLSGDFGGALTKLKDAIVGNFTGLFESSKLLWGGIWDLLKRVPWGDILAGLSRGGQQLWQWASDALGGMLRAFGDKWPEIQSWLAETLLPGIGNQLQRLGDFIGPVARAGFEALKDKAAEVWESSVKPWLQSVPSMVGDAIGNLQHWLTTTGGDLIQGLLSGAQDIWNNQLAPWLKAVLPGVPGALGSVARLLWDKGAELLQGLLGGAQDLWNNTLAPWLKSVIPGIPGALGTVEALLWRTGSELLQGLLSGAQDLWNNRLAPWITSVLPGVPGALGAVTDLLWAKGAELLQGLLGGAQDLWNNTVAPWLKAILPGIPGALGSVAELLWATGTELIQGLLSGAQNIWNNTLAPWIKSVLPGLPNALGSVAELLLGKGTELVQGLLDGAKQKWDDDLSPWLGGLKDLAVAAIVAKAGEIKQWLVGVGTELLAGLETGITERWTGVSTWFGELKDKAIAALTSKAGEAGEWLKGIGLAVLTGLLSGVEAKWADLKTWFDGTKDRLLAFFGGDGGSAGTWLTDSGRAIIDGLRHGIVDFWNNTLSPWLTGFKATFISAFSGAAEWLQDSGRSVIDGLRHGVQDFWNNKLWPFISGIDDTIINFFAGAAGWLKDAGVNIISGLWEGMKAEWTNLTDWFAEQLGKLPGQTNEEVDAHSPARKLMPPGKNIVAGIWVGAEQVWPEFIRSFQGRLSSLADLCARGPSVGMQVPAMPWSGAAAVTALRVVPPVAAPSATAGGYAGPSSGNGTGGGTTIYQNNQFTISLAELEEMVEAGKFVRDLSATRSLYLGVA